MSAYKKVINVINHRDFLSYLLILSLSTLLIGYALSSIFLGVFIFFSIRHAVITKTKPSFNLRLVLPMVLYVFFVITIIWTVDVKLTLKGISRELPLLILPLVFSILPALKTINLFFILKRYTIANFVLALFFLFTAFLRFIDTWSFSEFTYHDLVLALELNAIYVSFYFLISLFYLLGKDNVSKFEMLLSVFFIGMLMLLSSKTAILILLCGLLLKGITHFVTEKKSIKKAIIVGSLVIVVIGFMSRKIVDRVSVEMDTNISEVFTKEKFNQVYPWTGTSIRLLQLRILSEQIEEDHIFWTGYGLFASRNSLKERHEKYNTYIAYHTYNYHNQYAQTMADTGFIGLLILIVILLYNLKRAIQVKNYFYFMFFFTLCVLFISETLLWVHRGIFMFSIMYCLLCRTEFKRLSVN